MPSTKTVVHANGHKITFTYDRFRKDKAPKFDCFGMIADGSSVYFFLNPEAHAALAAELRNVANVIDGGQPVSQEEHR